MNWEIGNRSIDICDATFISDKYIPALIFPQSALMVIHTFLVLREYFDYTNTNPSGAGLSTHANIKIDTTLENLKNKSRRILVLGRWFLLMKYNGQSEQVVVIRCGQTSLGISFDISSCLLLL